MNSNLLPKGMYKWMMEHICGKIDGRTGTELKIFLYTNICKYGLGYL